MSINSRKRSGVIIAGAIVAALAIGTSMASAAHP
jgi:hypothetical protein